MDTKITPPPKGILRFLLLGLCFLSPIPFGVIVGLIYFNKPDLDNREFGKEAFIASAMFFVWLCMMAGLVMIIGLVGGLAASP